jgi:hypothetical protein
MQIGLRFAGAAALCFLLAGCTHSRIYHSVQWMGTLDAYPPRSCIEPAVMAVPGYDHYSWAGKLFVARTEPGPRTQEDSYEVSTKSMTFDLWVAHLTKGGALLRLTYYRPENPEMTAAGNALLADIAARCAIPDLKQRMRYEYLQEPHGVPFWSQ